MSKIYGFLLFLTLLTFNFIVYSEEVTVEGIGAIKGNEIGKARDEAIWDAQRLAVEQGVGLFLGARTVTENARLLDDMIYTQANGFVEKFDILEEKAEASGIYHVKIKAVVKSLELGNRLIMIGLLKKIGDPRIMIVMQEYQDNAAIPDPTSESVLIKSFLEAGYRLVDKSAVDKIRYNDSIKKILEGNTEAAQEIARHNRADILIVGSANCQLVTTEGLGGMISSRARIDVKAINIDTGELMVADFDSQGALDVTALNAGKRAIEVTGEKLSKKVIEKVAQYLIKRPTLQLMFSNINSDIYTKIIEALSNERTIKKVFPREISGTVGLIDIDYNRSAEELKKLIENLKDIKLKSKNFSRSKMEFSPLLPVQIEIKGLKNLAEFNNFVNELKKIQQLELIDKSKRFNSNAASLSIYYSESLFDLFSKFSDYETLDISDTKVVLKKDK